jgi:hypothetical protein
MAGNPRPSKHYVTIDEFMVALQGSLQEWLSDRHKSSDFHHPADLMMDVETFASAAWHMIYAFPEEVVPNADL